MKRVSFYSWRVGLAGLALAAFLPACSPRVRKGLEGEGAGEGKHFARPALPSDNVHPGGLQYPFPVLVRDAVVSNTNPNLKNTDDWGDSEPSIAVDPGNPQRVVMLAYSGHFGDPQTNAPLWFSANGGLSWTKSFSQQPTAGRIPPAFGPCDQTPEFNRFGALFTTFLVCKDQPPDAGQNVVTSGAPRGPGIPSPAFLSESGLSPLTNFNDPNNADQPWVLNLRDPQLAARDNTYVHYVQLHAENGAFMRVSAAQGTVPPAFVSDTVAGQGGGGGADAGMRPAGDPRTGDLYALFQRGVAVSGSVPGLVTISYFLNRSTDGGQTWGLNGSEGGIEVAQALSQQGTGFKFGSVNALIGGIDHAAVDPNSSAVYYVFGRRDSDQPGASNRLAMVRLQPGPNGGLEVGEEHLVTTQKTVQAALPSVAVTRNGTVGVLYTTFDGFSQDEFPIFSGHLAVSRDLGVTFQDLLLLTFTSAEKDETSDPRQRVLGDYQQLKAAGNTFYGVFTGNGIPFGRTVSNLDPIFVKAQIAPPGRVVAQPQRRDFGLVTRNNSRSLPVLLVNPTPNQVTVANLEIDNPLYQVTGPNTPFDVPPGGRVPLTVTFRPWPAGSAAPPNGVQRATLRVWNTGPVTPATVQLVGVFRR